MVSRKSTRMKSTLRSLDERLNRPVQQLSFGKSTASTHQRSTTSPTSPSTPLDLALSIISIAVARYHRAGPAFRKLSETTLWIFAAGTWNRSRYDHEVDRAHENLPAVKSVEEDVVAGKNLVLEALGILRKAEMMDAVDLEDAWRTFEKGIW